MKKVTLLCCLFIASLTMTAQITTPQPSPAAKVQQTVGLTEVTIDYSRPAMRGRAIYGNLVPFDKLWRTGANKNTIISFSDAVEIAGKKVEKGDYSIFTKPRDGMWEIYFYTDTENWGTPQNWDATKVAAIVKMEPKELASDVESFTISVDGVNNDGATLNISWERTLVSIPFTVPTTEKANASIDKVMNGPSANDYYAAASFYTQSGGDANKAKEWLEKATSMRPEAFWMMRQLSLVKSKLGDKKGAIAAAKKSLEVAKKAGNADYVKLNEDSLKEWSGM